MSSSQYNPQDKQLKPKNKLDRSLKQKSKTIPQSVIKKQEQKKQAHQVREKSQKKHSIRSTPAKKNLKQTKSEYMYLASTQLKKIRKFPIYIDETIGIKPKYGIQSIQMKIDQDYSSDQEVIQYGIKRTLKSLKNCMAKENSQENDTSDNGYSTDYDEQ